MGRPGSSCRPLRPTSMTRNHRAPNHQLTRLSAGRCKPEPAPGTRKCIPSPMPFGKLSRPPASTLVRFADRDPIGMACVVGAIKKAPTVTTVYTICSQMSRSTWKFCSREVDFQGRDYRRANRITLARAGVILAPDTETAEAQVAEVYQISDTPIGRVGAEKRLRVIYRCQRGLRS
jgi:hypothetical protein